ncbi:MAG TPA: LD-carboxypeptidase, partial [Candidatus Bathyarchaeia archaeon]|nr:LD-carboxypeptidase [Candidatus Bathyarchaeia archaeon]
DRHGYMAGRDADRAADLHAVLADPEVKAIVCLQGGYGTPRLIPLLDEGVFAANPKALCGYSDLTTLHLATSRWGNVISFYSNGASGVGSPEVTDFSKTSLHRALFSDEPFGPIGPNPDDPWIRTVVGGRATGRLAGGCAGLLASAIGTRLQPDFRGRIVVLEEIELEGYVLDGILTHLCNAGLFDGAAGIVVGDLNTKWSGGIAELSTEDIVEEVLGPLGLPLIFGLPIGHNKHHATVPLGALATLDADKGTLVVEEVVTAD